LATPRPIEDAQNPAGRLPENFGPAYRSGPFDAFPNAGLFFAKRVAAALDASSTPSTIYVSALNHSLLGDVANGLVFSSNISLVEAIFTGAHPFPFRNYHDALPDDELFVDTEHLTAEGHRRMVDLILRDNASLFDRIFGHNVN
jgi:hypothetical protein